uniref:Ig-like domain-containing protein n=1 Tax=Salmo trutta TaxID=8032 RepID=A0A673W0H6_SALTR
NVVLACLAHKGFPEGWKLGWRLGVGGALQGSQSLEVLEKDGHYSWSSSLTLPTDQCWKAGSTPCTQRTPTYLSFYHSKYLSRASALVINLGLCVFKSVPVWEVDGLEVSQGVVTSPEEEKEGLYRRSSTLTLSKAGWEQGELYTCRVSHFQHTQASPLRRTGPTVSPTVSLLPPSSEQLSGGSASLACLLTGYSPQGALVSWEVDGLEVSQGVVTSPEEEKEGLYRRSSTLTLSKAGWEQGELYTCRVSHFKHTQASPLRRSQCLV